MLEKKEMNSFSYYVYRVKEKLFSKLNKSKAFRTSLGLKNINMSLRVIHPETDGNEIVMISPDELFLGFDYLKDDYTLLDTSIKKSPHYDMMKKLYEEKDISDCEYIKRWVSGTLDWRYGFIKPDNFDFFVKRFIQSKENIEKNTIKPVIIYSFCGKYYIYDGKHRAAMCAYNEMSVPCIVIDTEHIFSGVWEEMFKKILNRKYYRKHTEFYNKYAS